MADIDITLHKENYYGAADIVIAEVFALRESHFWAEAPWRRKLRLARKLFQTIEQRLKLNWAARSSRPHEVWKTADSERLKILNMLGDPLRLYFTNSYDGGFDEIIRMPITNKQGRYLTKLARKKKGWLHVTDMVMCRHYKMPIAAIPFRNNWSGYPSINYNAYWSGAKQYKEFMKSKKSLKTLQEMEQLNGRETETK